MSSHQCYLKGQLSLRDGVTADQVNGAFKAFLEGQGLSFADLTASDQISVDASNILNIDIPFWSQGYFNDEVEEAAIALGTICEGDDWIEQHDIDTGDSEASLIPYFIGATPELRLAARRKYGLLQAQTWLEPILGKDAFAKVQDFAAGFPLQETKEGR
ncbi:hypothetical protein K2O51_31155 (plasmid) [Cupriavidus pinatubonensis]|uniref:hypothetical protein n=1 Tax=Cupriavidus pinatubonensis TaxID=248026 RepID=UPI001C72D4CF|nr:hypothetical protein [Cupriavidus pinatubonensis]QYY33705.1 hypothetical protein K2O51_31155 [Cupriavidus pinatubonensis]